MQLDDIINTQWLDAKSLQTQYLNAKPYPHIVMHDFIKKDLLRSVLEEFPDLEKLSDSVYKFNNDKQIKFASKGMKYLSPKALYLNSYLQSDMMLNWLNDLSGIKETLISDPYLLGGGYHEIRSGGLLKVHADFNKHSKLNLDRRLNLLIYLNEFWEDNWGGALELYDENLNSIKSIFPYFNTAVIFSTTSFTFHGHPDPLKCPENHSRKSLAYYYFSTGRPKNEISQQEHQTLWRNRSFETNLISINPKRLINEITPPIIWKTIKKIIGK